MNVSGIVNWAATILRVFGKLSTVEQETFGFLKDFKKLIKELENVFDMTHKMLKLIKNKGISYENLAQCTLLSTQYSAKIPIVLIDKLNTYFKEVKGKLPNATTIWHALVLLSST